MTRTTLNASLLALALSSVLHASLADAQVRDRFRDRERPRASQSEAAPAAENQYPNATREEPKLETGRNTAKIQRAFDELGEGNNDKARELLADLDGNARLSKYEQALVDQGLAQVAYDADDIDEAIRRWQKAVDGNGLANNDHFNMLYQVAQLQFGEERYEDALKTLERWQRESGSNKPEAIALKGNALYRLERHDEAIAVLDQAIAAAGDKADASLYELKMASYYDKEDYAGAAAALEELVRKQPNEVRHQITLAQMYIELEQNDRALGILQRAQQGGQLKEEAHWRQLYQLLAYAEKPVEAAAAITAGLQAGALKEDKDTLRALGDNYYMAEQVPQAIEAYGRAAAASPDDGNADQQRGHLLVDEERYAEAKQALETALRKGKLRDEGTAYLLLGMAESELGNTAAARTHLQKAATYDSARTNAESWLKNL